MNAKYTSFPTGLVVLMLCFCLGCDTFKPTPEWVRSEKTRYPDETAAETAAWYSFGFVMQIAGPLLVSH